MARTYLTLALLLGSASVATAQQSQQGAVSGGPMVRVEVDESARRVDVTVDGRPFTSYLFPTDIQKPVLHPLLTASGKPVTRGFPLDPRPGERADHPHHIGLWFNYGDVNGLDFWNNSSAVPAARAPRMGTVVHREVRRAESGRDRGELEVSMDWVDHEGKVLLREETRFVFHAGEELRVVDRITTLRALSEPVSMTDNKEGVLGLRVARGLEHPSTSPTVLIDASGRPAQAPVLDNEGVTGRYLSSEGLQGDDVWGTRARWTALMGTLEGEPVTVAILDHPGNVGFPTYWHARGYGLFAANPLGQSELSGGTDRLDFGLAPGESTTFRHRVVVLSGTASAERLERLYGEWSAERAD
jgi:hypothetical protein